MIFSAASKRLLQRGLTGGGICTTVLVKYGGVHWPVRADYPDGDPEPPGGSVRRHHPRESRATRQPKENLAGRRVRDVGPAGRQGPGFVTALRSDARERRAIETLLPVRGAGRAGAGRIRRDSETSVGSGVRDLGRHHGRSGATPEMEPGPSKVIEAIVSLLLPPACREEVLGDMRERNESTGGFLREAISTVPCVIYSRVRRTTDAVVVLMEALT